MAAQPDSAAAPWHAAYPSPVAGPILKISAAKLLSLMKEQQGSTQQDFLVVDLRKADHQVMTPSSVELPWGQSGRVVLSALRRKISKKTAHAPKQVLF